MYPVSHATSPQEKASFRCVIKGKEGGRGDKAKWEVGKRQTLVTHFDAILQAVYAPSPHPPLLCFMSSIPEEKEAMHVENDDLKCLEITFTGWEERRIEAEAEKHKWEGLERGKGRGEVGEGREDRTSKGKRR